MWPIQKQKALDFLCRLCFCCCYLHDFCHRVVDFFVKVDQHSGGSDAPSIVFLVICHLETEFVGIVGACDTDL